MKRRRLVLSGAAAGLAVTMTPASAFAAGSNSSLGEAELQALKHTALAYLRDQACRVTSARLSASAGRAIPGTARQARAYESRMDRLDATRQYLASLHGGYGRQITTSCSTVQVRSGSSTA